MSSDHWNFLANLLGTPGAPEPPKDESKEQEEQPPDATSESTPGPEPIASASTTDLASESTSDPIPENESSDGEAVLDALKTAVPQELLPGFASEQDVPVEGEGSAVDSEGASAVTQLEDALGDDEAAATSQESLPAESDRGETDEMAWGDLAKELGVEPDNVPPTPSRESSVQETPRARERSPRSKTEKPSGGFGSGLGIDLGPEPQEPDDAAVSMDADRELESSDIADLPPRRQPGRGRERAGEKSRGGRSGRRSRGEGDDREADRSSRGRSERQHRDDETSDRVSDEPGFGDERPDREESEESTQRRRRGRRGARQRVSEEELQRTERGVESGDAEDAEQSRPRRGGRRGQRRSEGEPGREPRARKDWDELDTDSGSLSSPGEQDQEQEQEQEEDDSTRSRSRRRGRRGRGRGRGREQDGPRRDVVAENDDDPLARESAFDDDHEDDIEVEVIRRGRRPRSRSRDRDDSSRDDSSRDDSSRDDSSRDDSSRDDSSLDDSSLDDSSLDDSGREASRDKQRSRDRDEDERPPRSRRWREGSDSDEESSETDVRRRAGLPTWIETVELLVSANIENHKKSKGGGRGRGGRRR